MYFEESRLVQRVVESKHFIKCNDPTRCMHGGHIFTGYVILCYKTLSKSSRSLCRLLMKLLYSRDDAELGKNCHLI